MGFITAYDSDGHSVYVKSVSRYEQDFLVRSSIDEDTFETESLFLI